MAHLVRNVYVGRVGYGPAFGNASNVPEDVAVQITNPAAWADDPEPESKPAPVRAAAKKK